MVTQPKDLEMVVRLSVFLDLSKTIFIASRSIGRYTRTAGFLSYYEICTNIKEGWTKKWNDEQKVAFAFNQNDWVSFEDRKSITFKVKYVSKFNK